MLAATHYSEPYAVLNVSKVSIQVFDSSLQRNRPLEFNVGTRNVILGWDIGIASMKKGEKAVLVCGPQYAYGSSGAGRVIPPNATLKFEVELLEFEEGSSSSGSSSTLLMVALILLMYFLWRMNQQQQITK